MNALRENIEQIKGKLAQIIELNNQASNSEKLDKSELLIDLEQKTRLMDLSDEQVEKVRNELKTENLKCAVLCERFKVPFLSLQLNFIRLVGILGFN